MKKPKPPKNLVIKRKGWSSIVCAVAMDDVGYIAEIYSDGDGASSYVDIMTPKQAYRVACWLMEFQEFLEKVGE